MRIKTKVLSKRNHANSSCTEHVDLETLAEMNTRQSVRHGWKPKGVMMQRADARWHTQRYVDHITRENLVTDIAVNLYIQKIGER